MSLLQNSNAISAGGYNITDSLRFRRSSTTYLERTPSSSGTSSTQATWSMWAKLSQAAGSDIGCLFEQGETSADRVFIFYRGNGVSYPGALQFGYGISGSYRQIIANNNDTSIKFVDPSAWYHLVFVLDTPNATQADRLRMYVNGQRITPGYDQTSIITQSQSTRINTTDKIRIGNQTYADANQFDGYLTEYNFIDGQALDPSYFGSTNADGVWSPKKYTGTYGTNGFYLPMKETTQATGFNTVTFTGTNATQSISNVGFSPDLVWFKNRSGANNNALYDTVRGRALSLISNATNSDITSSAGNDLASFDSNGFTVGPIQNHTSTNGSGQNIVAWCWDATSDNTTGSELITNGTFDTDTSSWTAVNGTLSASGQKLTVTRTGAGFGVAYQAITTTSGKMYAVKFDTEYVAGNGNFVLVGTTASGTEIATIGPYTADSNNTVATFIATGTTTYITLFADTLIGVDAIWDNISVKEVTQDGTIPSYCKTNTDYGFSIVSYTGTGANATVGHGLSSAPSMYVVKTRDTAGDEWCVYHKDLTDASYYLYLNSTNAEAVAANFWNSTAPTSSVFNLGSNGRTNRSGDNFIAYCFSEVAGFSKFGSYTGNGSTSGPTVTTGFRPAFVMIKGIDSARAWNIYDNTRVVNNPINKGLYPNNSDAETTAVNVNYTDTGFEIKTT